MNKISKVLLKKEKDKTGFLIFSTKNIAVSWLLRNKNGA